MQYFTRADNTLVCFLFIYNILLYIIYLLLFFVWLIFVRRHPLFYYVNTRHFGVYTMPVTTPLCLRILLYQAKSL